MLKKAVVLVTVILTVTTFPNAFCFLYQTFGDPPNQVPPLDYNKPQISFLVENSITTAFSLFQTSLLFIGASWGLVAIEKEILCQTADRIVFCLGSICLLFSCFSYHRYHDYLCQQVQDSAVDGFIPDLRSPFVMENYYAQAWGVVAGAICIGTSIVSAKWFK